MIYLKAVKNYYPREQLVFATKVDGKIYSVIETQHSFAAFDIIFRDFNQWQDLD